MKRTIAFLLVILGCIVLIYGGISYSRQRTVVDMGGVKATVTDHRNVPVTPIVGGIVLIGGIALLVTGKRHA